MKTSFCLSWPNSFFYQLHYTMHLNHLNIWCVNLKHIISAYNAKLPTLYPTFYKLQLFPDGSKFHNLSGRLLTVKKCFVKKKLLYFMCWEKGGRGKHAQLQQQGQNNTPWRALPSHVTYHTLQRGHHKLQNSSQTQQWVGAGKIISTADGFSLHYHPVDTMSL